jgi:hypothetical protein
MGKCRDPPQPSDLGGNPSPASGSTSPASEQQECSPCAPLQQHLSPPTAQQQTDRGEVLDTINGSMAQTRMVRRNVR